MIQNQGVFSKKGLFGLIESGRIKTLSGFKKEHVSPASIDVTSTGEAFRVNKLLPPSQLTNESIRSLLPQMGASRIDVGSVMEVGSTYLMKASLDINFPPGVYGYLNAKSSSGRNFLFVRSLADGIHMFDSVDRRDRGYSGELWLVIQPLAYPIIFTVKECYSQLRVFNGDTRFKQVDLDNLLLKKDLLFRRNKEPYPQGELSLFTHDGSVLCTLHAPPDKIIGYKAKDTTKPLDLLARKELDPRDYFDAVYSERFGSGKYDSGVYAEARKYYLFATNEMIRIPTLHTAELMAVDTRLGFVFTHFAGFFDPGFFGTATLEVFAPQGEFLRHKKPLARFAFETMLEETVSYGKKGNYQEQIETQLPKQFKPW